MSHSDTFLLEMSGTVSLKTTTEDYFKGKKSQNFTFFDAIALNQKV